MSILTKEQFKNYGPRSDATLVADYGPNARLAVTVRYDDQCGNGHNSFSITGAVKATRGVEACGCLHDDIARLFPELAPFIKWHLTSSDEPMHYVMNTLYWLGYQGWCQARNTWDKVPPNLEFARNSAVWPDMPESYVCPERLRSPGDVPRIKDMNVMQMEAYNMSLLIRTALTDRLGTLKADFRNAVEFLGFVY